MKPRRHQGPAVKLSFVMAFALQYLWYLVSHTLLARGFTKLLTGPEMPHLLIVNIILLVNVKLCVAHLSN